MNNQPENYNLMNVAIQNAIIAAIANVAGVLTIYFMGPSYFAPGVVNYIILMCLFFIPVCVAIWSALQLKKLNGGYITLKELFKYLFITFVIVETVYVLFNVILFKYIDPAFMQQVVVLTIKNMSKFLHDRGMDQDVIKLSLTKMTDGFKDMYSFWKLSLNWATSIIKDALVAVIIAAIIKKDKPPQSLIPFESPIS